MISMGKKVAGLTKATYSIQFRRALPAVITAVNVACTLVLAFTAWSSNITTTKQVDLIGTMKQDLQQLKVFGQRDLFDIALDEAESYCLACSSCSPAYMIVVSLDKALRSESDASELLTAAEYNRLAMLGSSVWSFDRAEMYAQKAFQKSDTSLDRFFSNVTLGHIHFRHSRNDPERAKPETARKYFNEAIKSQQADSGTDIGQFRLGQGYALWAMHEAFLHNDVEAEQQRDFAETSWKKLPDAETLVKEMDERIKAAKDGASPDLACLFRAKSKPTETYYLVKSPVDLSKPTTEPSSVLKPASEKESSDSFRLPK
jgi:hypothetical protein